MSSISPRKSCFCSSVAPSNYKKKRNKIDEFCYILAITLGREKTSKKKKKALYLSVNVLSTKVLIGDTIFTSPTGDGTAILRGHPSHAKV